jgi:hypothetical protein
VGELITDIQRELSQLIRQVEQVRLELLETSKKS